ncbi:hypothetical protein [Streptomyces sp. NPDC006285]|uniref:hypothetical protein n=1 Tax=Streptomyces sp. NPDC006285 TaxID=3364742 RepID=UPI0036CC63D2
MVWDAEHLWTNTWTAASPDKEPSAPDQQALDEAARINSTLVASRLNTLLDTTQPYRTAGDADVRTRARDLAAARPTTIAA